MPDYRLFRLSEANGVVEALDFNAADDAAAIEQAIRIDHAAAIWCRTWLLARVDPGIETPNLG